MPRRSRRVRPESQCGSLRSAYGQCRGARRSWKRSVSGGLGSFVALPKSHVSVPRHTYVRETFGDSVVRSLPMRVSKVIILLVGSEIDGMRIVQRAVFFATSPVVTRFVANAAGDSESGRFSTGDGMYSSA